MEFLRFGSSIPGEYWGCCACCIIQNFKQDPDTKASIQKVSGDGGGPVATEGGFRFYGKTLREIFWARLREGTFGSGDMANHAFLAILEDSQTTNSVGSKWLAILKEAGFEFIRTVDNSVWSPKKNHIFGLFRNINGSVVPNQFQPPAAWTALPSVKPEAWQSITDGTAFTNEQKKVDQQIWDRIGPAKTYTEDELTKDGVPVILSGLRSAFPPQRKEKRTPELEALKAKGVVYQPKPGTNNPY